MKFPSQKENIMSLKSHFSKILAAGLVLFISAPGFTMVDDKERPIRSFNHYAAIGNRPHGEHQSLYTDPLTGEAQRYALFNKSGWSYTVYMPLPENIHLAEIDPKDRPLVLEAIRRGLISEDDEKAAKVVVGLKSMGIPISAEVIAERLSDVANPRKGALDGQSSTKEVVAALFPYLEREDAQGTYPLFSGPFKLSDSYSLEIFVTKDGKIDHYRAKNKTGFTTTFYLPLDESASLSTIPPQHRSSILDVAKHNGIQLNERVFSAFSMLLRLSAQITRENIESALQQIPYTSELPTSSLLSLILTGDSTKLFSSPSVLPQKFPPQESFSSHGSDHPLSSSSVRRDSSREAVSASHPSFSLQSPPSDVTSFAVDIGQDTFLEVNFPLDENPLISPIEPRLRPAVWSAIEAGLINGKNPRLIKAVANLADAGEDITPLSLQKAVQQISNVYTIENFTRALQIAQEHAHKMRQGRSTAASSNFLDSRVQPSRSLSSSYAFGKAEPKTQQFSGQRGLYNLEELNSRRAGQHQQASFPVSSIGDAVRSLKSDSEDVAALIASSSLQQETVSPNIRKFVADAFQESASSSTNFFQPEREAPLRKSFDARYSSQKPVSSVTTPAYLPQPNEGPLDYFIRLKAQGPWKAAHKAEIAAALLKPFKFN